MFISFFTCFVSTRIHWKGHVCGSRKEYMSLKRPAELICNTSWIQAVWSNLIRFKKKPCWQSSEELKWFCFDLIWKLFISSCFVNSKIPSFTTDMLHFTSWNYCQICVPWQPSFKTKARIELFYRNNFIKQKSTKRFLPRVNHTRH